MDLYCAVLSHFFCEDLNNGYLYLSALYVKIIVFILTLLKTFHFKRDSKSIFSIKHFTPQIYITYVSHTYPPGERKININLTIPFDLMF